MRSKTLTLTLWTALVLGALAPLAAQNGPANKQASLAEATQGLSGELLYQANVIGARLKVRGKEESDYVGELTDATGRKKELHITHAISGAVAIVTSDQGKSPQAPVKFDGMQATGFADRLDESLLETFAADTIEGLLYTRRNGGAVRLLGRGFGPDPLLHPEYKGPRYDIFEAVDAPRIRPDGPVRMKRYYFDSSSGLLVSTRYLDRSTSPESTVETRFSDWRIVDGSVYPGRIERFENEHRVFSFVATSIASRSKQTTAITQ